MEVRVLSRAPNKERVKMNNNVEKWLLDNPKVTELFNNLNKNNIRWGIYAGAAANLLTNNRLPTDIDILIHNDDFNKVSSLIKDITISTNMVGDTQTSDNKILQYKYDNIELCINKTEIEITSNLQEIIDSTIHNLYLTDLAIKNRIAIKIAKTIVYITNPFDTIAIKSIMQRGAEQNKFDFPDSQAIITSCKIDKNYITNRAKEMLLTDREIIFLQKAGLDI